MTVDTQKITKYVKSLDSHKRNLIRRKYGLCTKSVIFLYVGRLEDYKGYKILLEAFESLWDDSAKIELILVGGGSGLSEISSRTFAKDGLMSVGRKSGDDLLDLFAVADVSIVPSLSEQWGLVVNESLAAGLPVIVSDQVGCIDDLVEGGENGVIVRSGSPEALAQAIVKLANDSKTREEMSIQGLRIIKPWTLQNEAKILVSKWNEL